METWILKVKISVLWLFYSVAFLAVMCVYVAFEPGALLEQIDLRTMAGEIYLLLILTILLLVPLIMAFLSLTLKDSANRWTNIILGTVYVGLQVIAFIEGLAQPSAHMILLEGAKVVAPALIVWYAWKWPKQQL